MRKLIYYVACSVDGFIAREDGSLADFDMGGEHFADLLSEYPETIPGHLREHLNVSGANKHFDAVVMGRRTFEVGLELGVTNPYPHLDQYLVSKSLRTTPDQHITLINEKPNAFVRELKSESGKDIWLCGGGNLASTLLPQIDELVLKVNPFLMGSGISLIRGALHKTTLEMKDKKIYDNGFMLLHYVVRT